jgi:hypothetical protein
MDFDRLRTGEQIAGISGVALILIMFIFSWFGIEGFDEGANAWESFSVIDLILFLAAAVAIALAVATAAGEQVNLPVALSAIVAGLGIIAVILVVIRIISPPDFGVESFAIELPGGGAVETPEIDTTREIGAWLGLIASLGIAYGGWRSMQDEGTTFGAQADRLQDRVGGGDEPPAPPPPPPPPSSAPPSAP